MTPARFDTLRFTRDISSPPATVWQAWTDPGMRAAWSTNAPGISVSYLESDTRVGGREIALCRSPGDPEMRVETRWLALAAPSRSVSSEAVEAGGAPLSAALVTAEIAADGAGSHLAVTVQIAALAGRDMAADYSAGFGAGLDSLTDMAGRTMVMERVIDAPVAAVWAAWTDPDCLQSWWGPDGFTCRSQRIDLRAGGEWVFDMIGPDGAVYPNHHRYTAMEPEARLAYTLLWGEDGPKHADAWASFADEGGRTRVTLAMTLVTAEEYRTAKGFGAEELGQQTLGKLARAVAVRARTRRAG
ncbi:MAG: SRPBCC domain-containing protein [Rhodobacteraceae bacterium]|nr:SRPBCC domain-containing protein [Paracoccaceae bacterium]